jgi:serine/threonine protein phosphatase PrpC
MSDEQDTANDVAPPVEEVHGSSGSLLVASVGLTDVGCQRSTNQDTLGNLVGQFANRTDELGLLYAVADGMGGHARGEVASALAIENLFARYYASDPDVDPRENLAQVMIATNSAVHQAGSGNDDRGMGTTLTLALLQGRTLYVGNVGDSRTYRIRAGQIEQLSEDHSLIGEQVRQGLLSEAQAKKSNVRNVITRAVGYRAHVEPDTFAFPVEAGDILLLCSDGLHGLVENSELAEILSTQPLAQAVPALIALAKQRGGPDNITALAILIEQIDENAPVDIDAEVSTAPLPELRREEAVTAPLPALPEPAEEEAAPATPLGLMASPPGPPPSSPPPGAAPSATLPPPPASAPPPTPPITALPPAQSESPERHAPVWLFVLIPIVLLALAGGAFALFSNRPAKQAPQRVATLTTPPTALPALTPTTPLATSSVAAPAAGAAGLAATAPSPTATGTSRQEEAGTTVITGSISFGAGIAAPPDFASAWQVVLITATAGASDAPTGAITGDDLAGWSYRIAVPATVTSGAYQIEIRRTDKQQVLLLTPATVTIQAGQPLKVDLTVAGPAGPE